LFFINVLFAAENHPRPGKTFPSANIPIELLTQLQKTPVSSSRPGAHVPNEDANMEEDPSGNEDDDEEDDEDEPSGGNDDEDEDDDDEIIAEFTPTPEKAILTDNLPPESSPPPPIRPKAQSVARNAIWNASQISSGQRRTVVGEPVITPADRDHEMDIDQPPKSVDTARMFSSAVRPETILPGIQREPKKSNDSQSTLSSGNFPDSSYSLLPRTQRLSIHRKGSQHISSTNDFPVSSQGLLPGTQLQPNTIHGPLTQSSGNNISGSVRIMRPPPTRLVSAGHLDGVDSDLPSEVTTAMAEQQLLHDFKASVHQSSDDVQAPATPARLTNRRRSQRNSPASSMATSRKRRVPPEMSPKELREQKLSRFNFTQESPVSQDPAVSAAKARENFLKGRKNQKQIQQPEIPSSPPRVESAPSVAMEDSRSLYTEFRRAYPNYTGTNEHFETMCKKLAASCKMEQLLCHPILWDDFIARSVSDYLDYAQKKLLAAETLEPYEKFYNEQIEGSLHEKKVVTRAKLVAWLGPEAL
jgi:hypothetical protein